MSIQDVTKSLVVTAVKLVRLPLELIERAIPGRGARSPESELEPLQPDPGVSDKPKPREGLRPDPEAPKPRKPAARKPAAKRAATAKKPAAKKSSGAKKPAAKKAPAKRSTPKPKNTTAAEEPEVVDEATDGLEAATDRAVRRKRTSSRAPRRAAAGASARWRRSALEKEADLLLGAVVAPGALVLRRPLRMVGVDAGPALVAVVLGVGDEDEVVHDLRRGPAADVLGPEVLNARFGDPVGAADEAAWRGRGRAGYGEREDEGGCGESEEREPTAHAPKRKRTRWNLPRLERWQLTRQTSSPTCFCLQFQPLKPSSWPPAWKT